MLLVTNGCYYYNSASGCFQRITNFKSFKCLYLKKKKKKQRFTIGEITKCILGRTGPIFLKKKKGKKENIAPVNLCSQQQETKTKLQLLFMASQHNKHQKKPIPKNGPCSWFSYIKGKFFKLFSAPPGPELWAKMHFQLNLRLLKQVLCKSKPSLSSLIGAYCKRTQRQPSI